MIRRQIIAPCFSNVRAEEEIHLPNLHGIFYKPRRQHSFGKKRNDSILARIVNLSDVRLGKNFVGHVEQEREQPLTIGVEDISPRDENFKRKTRERVRRVFKGGKIIGLTSSDVFVEDVADELLKLRAANHHLPIGDGQSRQSAFGDDDIEVAKNFLRLVPRQNFFDGKARVVRCREKSAVVIEPDNGVRSVLPNPIERGDFVEIEIERADVVAGIVGHVAESFDGLSVSGVNDFVTFGQR